MFLVYSPKRDIIGFYKTLNQVNTVIANHNGNAYYVEITDELRSELDKTFLMYCYIDNIYENGTKINSLNSFKIVKPKTSINLLNLKNEIISMLSKECKESIINGIITDDFKHFTYSIEDQMNIKNLLDNNTITIYYHAEGETIQAYEYSYIREIYKELENNKTYNLIYFNVLKKWIMNNYTEEMFHKGLRKIEYGWSNENIIKEVNDLYDKQKLL